MNYLYDHYQYYYYECIFLALGVATAIICSVLLLWVLYVINAFPYCCPLEEFFLFFTSTGSCHSHYFDYFAAVNTTSYLGVSVLTPLRPQNLCRKVIIIGNFFYSASLRSTQTHCTLQHSLTFSALSQKNIIGNMFQKVIHM